MISLFFTQLLFGLIASIIIYITGKSVVVFYNIKADYFFKLFITLAIGILTIVYMFSVIWAHGITVNILLTPFLIYFFYHYRAKTIKPVIYWDEIKKEVLWILGAFILIYLYQSIFFFDFYNGVTRPLFNDYYEHSQISNTLRLFGTESTLVDLLYYFPEFRHQISPYHFAELWLNAFFTKLFVNSSVITLYLITISILISTFLIGICSLFEAKLKNRIHILLLSILCLFVTNVYSSQISFLSAHSFPWDGTVMGLCFQKQAFISIFGLLGFILLFKGFKIEGIIILLMLPIFAIAFLPGVLSGIVLYSLLEIIENGGKITKKQIILISIPFLFFIVYFGYCALFKSSFTSNYGSFGRIIQDCKYRLSVENFMRTFIVSLFFFLPYILILLRTSISFYRYWLFIAFCLFGGILASMIAGNLLNANQFTTNLSSLIIIVVIISFSNFVCTAKRTNKNIFIGSIFALVIVLTTVYTIKGKIENHDDIEDPQFLTSVAKCIKTDVSPVLTFNSEVLAGCYYTFYKITLALHQYTNKTIVFSSGNPEFYTKRVKMSYIDSNYYCNFTPLAVWRSKGKGYTLEKFITYYKVKYFHFRKGALVPEYIKQRADTIITSKLTHNFFIVIR